MLWVILAIGVLGIGAVIGLWIYVSIKATSRDT